MSFLANTSAREKGLIFYGGALVLAMIVYYYAWVPLQQRLLQLEADVPRKVAELAWVRHQIKIAEPWLNAGPDGVPDTPILTVIENHAGSAQVRAGIQRVQPQDGQVKVWFQEVSADRLFDFVGRMAAEGISVSSASIARSKDGRVNANLTLKR